MPADASSGSKDAAERVRQLATEIHPYHLKYERARDARAVFAYVYYNITLDLAEKLETSQPGFEDVVWVADLAVAFGKRFVSAMDSLDAWLTVGSGISPVQPDAIYKAVPRPWADVYLAIRDNRSYVLEDLVFSMMAHISYDLPNALFELKPDAYRLSDYHVMNDVLAKKTEFIQEVVARRYQRFLMWLDRLAGSFDEFLTNYGIRTARSVAWYNAARLLVPSSKEKAAASIERSTSFFIDSVRNPEVWWLRWAVRLFRLLIPRRRKWPKQRQEPSPGTEFTIREVEANSSRW